MNEDTMNFVHKVKVLIYIVGIAYLVTASLKATEPQVFWPPDMLPHPHVPHPNPNPNDNQA